MSHFDFDYFDFDYFSPWDDPCLDYGNGEVWSAGDGREIPISDLTDSHLLNIQRSLVWGTAKAPDPVKDRINQEVAFRGLEPLTFGSKESAHASSAVSKLYGSWNQR